MIFVRKGQNAKTSRLNKRPSHEVKAAQMQWQFAWLCSYFLCCLTGPCMIWYTELRLHRGVISGFVKAGKQNKKTKREKRKGEKKLSCTWSTPFICTCHAYGKRNKVYTQCCLCFFPLSLFLSPIQDKQMPTGGCSISFLCVFVCVFCSFNTVQDSDILVTKLLRPGGWFQSLVCAAAFLFCLVRVWFSLLPAPGGNDSGSCGGRFPNNRIRFFIFYFIPPPHWDAFLC